METKYTPGPWHRNIAPAAKYPIIFAGRNTHVAQVKTQGLSEAEQEANADLIAAAPDLADALLTMYRESDGGWANESPTAFKVREALRKAGIEA
jgi:hypothetical protein